MEVNSQRPKSKIILSRQFQTILGPISCLIRREAQNQGPTSWILSEGHLEKVPYLLHSGQLFLK